jgi:hypothetical protein
MLMMEVTENADRVGQILRDLRYDLVDASTGEKITVPRFATAAIPGDV